MSSNVDVDVDIEVDVDIKPDPDPDTLTLARLSLAISSLRTPIRSPGNIDCAGGCKRVVSANAPNGLCMRCAEDRERRVRLERLGVVLPETRLIIPGLIPGRLL